MSDRRAPAGERARTLNCAPILDWGLDTIVEDASCSSIAVPNDVTSNRVNRDLHCGFLGAQTEFTDNLANFTAPALVIKADQGFGSIMDELPGKLGSASVTSYSIDPFAHVDHFGSPAH